MKISGNKVTQEFLEELLNNSEYQETVFWDKLLIRVYKLPNGHLITGQAYCVDPANFTLKEGRKIAYEDAIKELRPKVAFLLQDQLYESGKLQC